MIRMTSIATAGLALCLMVGAASAQTTPAAPAPAAPAPAAAPATPAPAGKMAAKPRTAQSIACSADADKQNLHGKARKTFMSSCKHKAM